MRTTLVFLIVLGYVAIVTAAAPADVRAARPDIGAMTYAPWEGQRLEMGIYEVGKIVLSKSMTRDKDGNEREGHDALIQLITTKVSRKSWAIHGGEGTIDYFPLTQTLVVNQTPELHRRIQKLLRELENQAEKER